jgi:uncharacterized membrane protein YdbT with pleckstrin-like domain
MSNQIALDDVLKTLRENYLFFGLDDFQLAEVVRSVEVYQVDRGAEISREGEPSQALFIVQSGKACQTKSAKGKEQYLRQITSGHSWGEDCLQTRVRVPYRVVAITSLLVIRIDRDILYDLANRIPQLAANLHIGSGSNTLLRRANIRWLEDGEEVFFIGRKHPLFLIKKLLLPIGALVGLLFLMALIAGWSGENSYGIWSVGLVLTVFCILWAGWNTLDWSNDYSIVTSLRIAWLERLYGLYDSRQEAPLSTIQSIDVQTSQLGRIFGYGNVIVRTYTGPLVLPDVEFPEDVATMIRQHWEQAQVNHKRDEISNIEQTLRQRLSQGQTGTTQAAAATTAPAEEVEPGFLQELFADFFKVRISSQGVVTYRKHWFILFRDSWKPILILFLLLGVWILRLNDAFTFVSSGATLAFLSMIAFGMLGWMAYIYLDWRNDVFQITQDQIIDLDKKPFGKEEKKIAQLENILSIEYKRLGIIGLLLNFGTVYIHVGTSQFTFDQVYDPSQVQQDLFRRMAEHQYRKQQRDIRAERERVGDWIATYHNHQDEFRTSPGSQLFTPQPEV